MEERSMVLEEPFVEHLGAVRSDKARLRRVAEVAHRMHFPENDSMCETSNQQISDVSKSLSVFVEGFVVAAAIIGSVAHVTIRKLFDPITKLDGDDRDPEGSGGGLAVPVPAAPLQDLLGTTIHAHHSPDLKAFWHRRSASTLLAAHSTCLFCIVLFETLKRSRRLAFVPSSLVLKRSIIVSSSGEAPISNKTARLSFATTIEALWATTFFAQACRSQDADRNGASADASASNLEMPPAFSSALACSKEKIVLINLKTELVVAHFWSSLAQATRPSVFIANGHRLTASGLSDWCTCKAGELQCFLHSWSPSVRQVLCSYMPVLRDRRFLYGRLCNA